jgi:hypothetical protein
MAGFLKNRGKKGAPIGDVLKKIPFRPIVIA